MPLLVDPSMSAHGDFLLVKRALSGNAFEIAAQRLFTSEEDALAAMPKVHGYDFYVVQVAAQHRAVITFAEIVDPRTPLIPPPGTVLDIRR